MFYEEGLIYMYFEFEKVKSYYIFVGYINVIFVVYYLVSLMSMK